MLETLLKKKPGDVTLSSLTVAELHYGAEKSSAIEKNREALGLFLTAFEILNFDIAAAEEYGRIRSVLEESGISKLKTQDWVVQ